MSLKGWRQRKEDKKKQPDADDVNTTPLLADSIPEEILATVDGEAEESQLHDNHESVIYHVTTDNESAEEITQCNIDPMHWDDELVDIQETVSVEAEDVANVVNVSSLFQLHEPQSDAENRRSTEDLRTNTRLRLSYDDALKILLLLRTNKNTNTKGQWNKKKKL